MMNLTKEYLDEKLGEQTQELKTHIDVKTEELARMAKKGFDGVDNQLGQIVEKLDVHAELDQLKEEVHTMKEKLEHSLNVKL